MGSLKPGATYIYESPDGGETVYAREFGETERHLVGYSHKAQSTRDRIQADQLWYDIRRTAQTHEGLQEELERVIIYYQLLKESDNTVMHHPV